LLQIGVDAGVIVVAGSASFNLVGDLTGMMGRRWVAGDTFLFIQQPGRLRSARQPLSQGLAATGVRVEWRTRFVARIAAVVPSRVG
jgi:hypothetical protein